MYGKYKVNNQNCYLVNALALVDLSKSKVGDIVKLYRYETEEELYLVAVVNNRDNTSIMWDSIQCEDNFKLYQALCIIPEYEEYCSKTVATHVKSGLV